MIELLEQKTASDTTRSNARALVTLDLGNGDVKAAVRMPGVGGWIRVKFPSTVRTANKNESGSIRLATAKGFTFYQVGEGGRAADAYQTGNSKEGKVTNARALLVHALRQVIEVKPGDTLHVDVVFTSPSNASYRERITNELVGSHGVMVPADESDLDGQDFNYSVHVHNAFGQLEGLRAVHLFGDEVAGNAYLIDIGHRTILVTKVNGRGVVQEKERHLFDDCGVAFIAKEIIRRELLANQMCFNASEAMSAVFDRKQRKALQPVIEPVLSEALQGAIASLSDEKAQRFVVGGGASLPGVAKLLGAKVVAGDPQWASLYGLAQVADKVVAKGAK